MYPRTIIQYVKGNRRKSKLMINIRSLLSYSVHSSREEKKIMSRKRHIRNSSDMWTGLTFKSYWWYSAHSSPYISHDTVEENLSTINEELFNLIAVLFSWALCLIYQWYSQGEFRCQFKGLKLTIFLNSWVCGYSHVAGYLSKSIKPHPKELCEGLTPILPSMVLWRPLYDVKVVLLEVTLQ